MDHNITRHGAITAPSLHHHCTITAPGFRKSCDTLYEYYKVEVGAVEDTLVEHLYDEYFIELDVDACAAFFRWFGVIKPAERTVAVAGAAAGDEVPSAVNVPLDAVVGQDEW